MQSILLVEDDAKLAGLLAAYLTRNGFQVQVTDDFRHVLDEFVEVKPDLVLMDVNLPQYDGYYWCRQIRTHSICPILFISARDSGMDQIMALEHGADDYITKPFQYEVVLAKVRSQLRRAYGSYAAVQQEVKVKNGPMILYPERFVLEYDQRSTELTQKEAILVEALMAKAGRVVSREKLLEQMWEDQHFIDDNTLNVYITRVRRKLKELGAEEILETVRGAGYRVLDLGSSDQGKGI
ncbi:response regulator transcription factor [Paenibacillus amylolyticus]|uniref:Winged helix family two component transcriptional regulator n=1 Tax=Paenibacillus amylolyticus TaxID=1451 RepID=A0A117I1P7_PAEAM|nr:response regulator transcription factor [Paenibacillus amylolyticus]GAS82579.1 winged helix family two component transcriptional regulator [Paenibacillus amylolyticus]